MSEGGEGFQPTQLPEVQQREALTDVQLGDLLSAAGNHEGKALLIAAMEPGEIYTARQLNRRLLEIQGEQPGWEMSYRLPSAWCEKSLGPIGLVAEEVTDKENNSYGYTLAEYGEKIGKPFVGLLLDWSRRHPEISLNQLFGNTHVRRDNSKEDQETDSPQNRSPITRYKLLWELVTADLPVRNIDIATGVNKESGLIGKHLQGLAEEGVIEYTSIFKEDKQHLQYKFVQPIDTQALQTLKERVLIRQVYDILSSDTDKTWTREDLANELVKNNLQNPINTITQRVSIALGALKKLGALENIDLSFLNYSSVNMTQDQRNAIIELLETIDLFQKQDIETIKKGSELAQFFATQPKDASQLMAKVHDSLSSTNNLPPNVVIGMLTSIIESSPNLNISSIQKLLLAKYDKKLSPERIQQLLNRGSVEGKFIRTDNKDSYWNIAATPDLPQEHSHGNEREEKNHTPLLENTI